MTDELLDLRDMLMRELNNGYFDSQSWKACATWARTEGRIEIAEQIEKYIKHYSEQGE